jgi:hypothetical protein
MCSDVLSRSVVCRGERLAAGFEVEPEDPISSAQLALFARPRLMLSIW